MFWLYFCFQLWTEPKNLTAKFQRKCIKKWKKLTVWTVFANLNPINVNFLDLKSLGYFPLLVDDQTIK